MRTYKSLAFHQLTSWRMEEQPCNLVSSCSNRPFSISGSPSFWSNSPGANIGAVVWDETDGGPGHGKPRRECVCVCSTTPWRRQCVQYNTIFVELRAGNASSYEKNIRMAPEKFDKLLLQPGWWSKTPTGEKPYTRDYSWQLR